MGVENIKIGACAVSFGGIDLGYTKGGVIVNIESSSEPTDEIGLPRHYDYYISEVGITVNCPLSENTIENIGMTFPWATDNSGVLSIGDNSHSKLRQHAKELKITPLSDDYEVIVPMAVPTSTVTLQYTHDSERLIDVTFRALTASSTDTTLIKMRPAT